MNGAEGEPGWQLPLWTDYRRNIESTVADGFVEQIVATPTLIKVLPEPLRRYIGNLANGVTVNLHITVTVNGVAELEAPTVSVDRGNSS